VKRLFLVFYPETKLFGNSKLKTDNIDSLIIEFEIDESSI
jgi:hypothetical protein